MKKFCLLLCVSVVSALVLSLSSTPMAMEARLIGIHAEEAMPEFAETLVNEPTEVQAAMLDLSGDPLLRLKAQAALLQYPSLARTVYPLYAAEPQFQAILRQYGPAALLPIAYFIEHDVRSIAIMDSANRYWQAMRDSMQAWWNGQATERERLASEEDALNEAALDEVARGHYAIRFITEQGHGFLGQFALHADGSVKWIQSERALEATTSLLAGGVRDLERRYRTGEEIDAGNLGWAAVDVAVMAGAVKLLRAGRMAATTTRTTGSAALASRFATSGQLMRYGRYAKWPLIAAAAYTAVRHPALISDALATLADWAGLPVRLVQLLGWTLLLLPVCYIASWLMRLFKPLVILLSLLARSFSRVFTRPDAGNASSAH